MAGGSSVSSLTGGGSADSVSVYLLLKENKKLSGAQLERKYSNGRKTFPAR